jgi:hypothetical protein
MTDKNAGIDTANPLVKSRSATWARVRDALAGGYVLRETTTARKYIPELSGQTAAEYAAYIDRATFLEATARTREAMTGLIFSRAPAYTDPTPATDVFAADIDASGTTIDDMARAIVDELQATGFGAIVVSHNGDPENPGTAANPSGRPFVQWYNAESVIDWKFSTINGARQLSALRLYETVDEAAGEFASVSVLQIRVLDLEQVEGVARLRERIYRLTEPDKKSKSKPKWEQVGVTLYPMQDGAPVTSLRAILVSADGNGLPGSVPLSPIAEINLSHWRTTADHEHALHFCGLPTPWIAGVQTAKPGRRDRALAEVDGDPVTGLENLRVNRAAYQQQPAIALGSTKFLMFDSAEAKIGILTMDVAGLSALENSLTRKERGMAVLGARMLSLESAGAASGVAIDLRQQGEQSALVRIANVVSSALTRALQWCAEWAGAPSETTYALDTSFARVRIDGATLTALLSAANAGKISRETFIYNVRQGGYLPDGITEADELERIANDPQPLADPFASFGPNSPPDDPPANDPEPVAA